MKRTHLPLNGMRVFDAAARHLSFTNAADELAVTPAAVGQQIRALEDMLGVVLFRRTPKGLELTSEAEAGLESLRSGFLELEESVRAMQSGQSSNSLTIAAPRDFIAKWLSAKLKQFSKDNPDIRFNIINADEDLDFTEANLDAAIRLCQSAGEHKGVRLDSGALTLIAHPDDNDAHDKRLIYWPGCCEADKKVDIRVGDAGLAIDAVTNGLGRAFVPLALADTDIKAGRVVAVKYDEMPGNNDYWLIAPLPQWRQDKVKKLVAALTN